MHFFYFLHFIFFSRLSWCCSYSLKLGPDKAEPGWPSWGKTWVCSSGTSRWASGWGRCPACLSRKSTWAPKGKLGGGTNKLVKRRTHTALRKIISASWFLIILILDKDNARKYQRQFLNDLLSWKKLSKPKNNPLTRPLDELTVINRIFFFFLENWV